MIKEITNVDGKFYEKCGVVVLPTDSLKRGVIRLMSDGIMGIEGIHELNEFIYPKSFNHLYIISNEKIKEGDYYVNTCGDTDPILCKCDDNQEAEDCNKLPHWCKKIIATTDESLSLPRPSNEFLKKFCELNGIWEVLVEYDNSECLELCGGMCAGDCPHGIRYTKLKTDPDNTITIKPVQEEKLYTREEVIEILNDTYSKFIAAGFASTPFQDWIKENL